MKYIALSLLLLASISTWASPCSGIDRTLTDQRKAVLAPVIAKQVAQQLSNVQSVDVLQSFQYQGWYIIYVNTHVSDEAFLIYKGEPTQNNYLDVWAGAFTMDEEEYVYRSLLNGKTKGIPKALARCFSWHITKDRDL